jgi:hypothetical protein
LVIACQSTLVIISSQFPVGKAHSSEDLEIHMASKYSDAIIYTGVLVENPLFWIRAFTWNQNVLDFEVFAYA